MIATTGAAITAATAPSTTTAPASAATVAATVLTAIAGSSAAVVATAEILAAAVAGATRAVALRWVVVGREILRRRGIGFGLALVASIAVCVSVQLAGKFAQRRGLRVGIAVEMFFAVMLFAVMVFTMMRCAGNIFGGAMFLAAAQGRKRRDVLQMLELVRSQRNFVEIYVRRVECFAGQQLDGGRGRGVRLGCGRRSVVRMAVIVILQILEHVADVQEGVAIEANFDECRLHAGEDARYFSFVNATDEGELFLALNVNLDQLTFFHNRDSAFVRACGNYQFFRHENSFYASPP
jgi:hypothetical protein